MAPFSNSRRSGPTGAQRTAAEREEARCERERRRARDPAQDPQSEHQSVPAEPPSQPVEPTPSPDVQSPIQASIDPASLRTEEHALTEPDTDHSDKPPQPAATIPDPPPQQPAAREIRHRLLEQRSRRRRASTGAHRGLTRARAVALAALIGALALVWFLLSLIQPFHGPGHGRVIVDIPKGSSSSQIGSVLQRDGVVSSGFFFDVRALIEGKRSDLHSGRYQLRLDMSYAAAIEALSKPPPAQIPVKVVIPEGFTRAQIAQLAHEDGLSGSYLQSSARSSLLDPARYGAPRSTGSLEGFLFPATYDMLAGAPASRLVAEQLTAFGENFGPQEIARAHALHITPYELLSVASMVEREALIAPDRPKIAAVIYNRLHRGMPLGIDATIYYAVEQQKGIPTYTGELTESDLHLDSPYNTRIHHGLPPTPISNPGMASIEAAAHPAHVPYLYYVAGADGCGEQVFSVTAAQFEANVAAYRAALARGGGKPPPCKHKR